MNRPAANPLSQNNKTMLAERPHAWIDATHVAADWPLWGMSLVERQIRQLARLGIDALRIWTPDPDQMAKSLRKDLKRLYSVQVDFDQAQDSQALYDALAAEEELVPVLLLEGDAIYDDRILEYLLNSKPGNGIVASNQTTVAYLAPHQIATVAEGDGALVQRIVVAGLSLFRPDDLDHYIPSLRLTMPPIMERPANAADLKRIDRLMYHRTFKGVIDGVARYGYYHLVRWITRQLSRTSLSPNLFTILSIAAVWAASPLFFVGQLGYGVLAAWLGVILDSVDGKLARLRLHLSEAMGKFEHISAAPALGLWYLSFGWYLCDGELMSDHPAAEATWLTLAAFVLDKMASGGFKAVFGREIFDYRPIDAAFHLIAARRNIWLLGLSIGVLFGKELEAFLAMADWMVFTLGFHLLRFAWVGLRRQ